MFLPVCGCFPWMVYQTYSTKIRKNLSNARRLNHYDSVFFDGFWACLGKDYMKILGKLVLLSRGLTFPTPQIGFTDWVPVLFSVSLLQNMQGSVSSVNFDLLERKLFLVLYYPFTRSEYLAIDLRVHRIESFASDSVMFYADLLLVRLIVLSLFLRLCISSKSWFPHSPDFRLRYNGKLCSLAKSLLPNVCNRHNLPDIVEVEYEMQNSAKVRIIIQVLLPIKVGQIRQRLVLWRKKFEILHANFFDLVWRILKTASAERIFSTALSHLWLELI